MMNKGVIPLKVNLNKSVIFDSSFVCPFCTGESKYVKKIHKEEIKEHIIVTKDETGHIHVHGPVWNKIIMKEFILTIAKEAEIEIEE